MKRVKNNHYSTRGLLWSWTVGAALFVSVYGPTVNVYAASDTAKCDSGKKVKVTADLAQPKTTLDDEDKKAACKEENSEFTPSAECVNKFQGSADTDAYRKGNCGSTNGCRLETDPSNPSRKILDCKNAIGPKVDDASEEYCKPTSFTGFITNSKGCITFASLVTSLLNLVAGFVGIAVVGGIVYGGFLYSQANGNSGKTQEAITIITNAVIGLLMFGFMYVLIQFLVPGGVL